MKQIEEMDIQEVLVEINRLARKNKVEGLSDSEIELRDKYRKRYLQLYREGFIDQLKSLKVVDENGNDITPDKLKKLKEEGRTNE